MWYAGTEPKHAPTPTFETDEKRKEEEAHSEISAGVWGVPKCLFKEWGQKMSVEKKFRPKTGKKKITRYCLARLCLHVSKLLALLEGEQVGKSRLSVPAF